MLGDLVRHGFSLTDDPEAADAVVLNTCAFVEDAKSESLEAIVEAAALNEDGRRRRIVVTGCLAQRYGESLANDLPEADLVVGFQVRSRARRQAPLRRKSPGGCVARCCRWSVEGGVLTGGSGQIPAPIPASCPNNPKPQNYAQLGNSLRSSMGLEPLAADAAAVSGIGGVAMPAPPAIDDPSAHAEADAGLVPSAPVGARVQVGSATVPFRPEWDRVRLTPRHTAYLRVAEGCNHAVRWDCGGMRLGVQPFQQRQQPGGLVELRQTRPPVAPMTPHSAPSVPSRASAASSAPSPLRRCWTRPGAWWLRVPWSSTSSRRCAAHLASSEPRPLLLLRSCCCGVRAGFDPQLRSQHRRNSH
jgi:hypothetical protein